MHPRPSTFATLAVSIALATAGCTSDGDAPTNAASRTATPPTPVDSPSPTRPPVPPTPPETRGARSTACVEGWVTPPRGSPRFSSPIGVIRRTTGVRGPLEVVDLRYFEGPESPPSDKGYLLVVQRWYVKLFARGDFSFAGRFLVEARRFGQGLAAVAPYDTTGFSSPDWVGFQLSADPTPRSYPGLPSAWAGIAYDFVTGGEGLTIPGLPDEVAGCLDGT